MEDSALYALGPAIEPMTRIFGRSWATFTAWRELAEEGKKVYLVEKQTEEGYAAVGNEFASLNASILQERGVPHIDPVEFYQNTQHREKQ